jgi:hypothetical protein
MLWVGLASVISNTKSSEHVKFRRTTDKIRISVFLGGGLFPDALGGPVYGALKIRVRTSFATASRLIVITGEGNVSE